MEKKENTNSIKEKLGKLRARSAGNDWEPLLDEIEAEMKKSGLPPEHFGTAAIELERLRREGLIWDIAVKVNRYKKEPDDTLEKEITSRLQKIQEMSLDIDDVAILGGMDPGYLMRFARAKHGKITRIVTLGDLKKLSPKEREIFERLANIEHLRWAGWQRHLHGKCRRDPEGNLIIPAEYAANLEKQINTGYNELTEKEKNYDRMEVLKNWPFIAELGD